ncbi:MAG: hypothetical protein AAGA67_11335 [Cyanobacteria bacterium P01_F01_bin.153]
MVIARTAIQPLPSVTVDIAPIKTSSQLVQMGDSLGRLASKIGATWKAIAQVGNFAPELVPLEDWDLWLRLAENFDFVAVPEVQMLYRISPTAQSANVRCLKRSYIACLNRTFERNIDDLEVQANRRQSFGNIDKYVLHKALDAPVNSNKRQNWSQFKLALRLFLNLVKFCPLFLAKRLTIKIFVRFLLLKLNSFFSIPKSLLGKLSNVTGVDALLGYIQLQKSS